MKPAKLFAAVIAVVVCAGITLVAPSSAHVKSGTEWYFYGAPQQDEGRPLVDPLTLFFRPGAGVSRPAGVNEVENVVGNNWPRMQAQDCLGTSQFGLNVRDVFNDGPQGVYFRNLEDPDESQFDEVDRQLSTARTKRDSEACGDQWHMRLWDDEEHAEISDHGEQGQWTVGAVHKERAVGAFDHELVTLRSKSWDTFRNSAVRQFGDSNLNRCRLYRWRYYPGGDRPYQGKRHDGYLSLVEFRRKRQGQRCFPNRRR
ncbi:MAG: hypothetical protein ACR2LK_00320 [Solirubrobacteraceae bacterium]